KDYEAAAIANSVLNRMIDRKVFDKAKIRSIYKSETFPTTGYGYAHNVEPKLVEKIKEAFFKFPWQGSALQAEFQKEGKFIPIDYRKDWAVLRKIDEATGVKYSCKEAFSLLARVGLDHMADKRADELSGGQRQRVGICRALIQNPELLLVDEPTASLDPKTSRQIMRLIKELCAERKLSAIINIHDVM